MTLGASLAYAGDIVSSPYESPGSRLGTAAPSEQVLQNAKPVVNALKPPDPSQVVLDTEAQPYRSGMMTKAGIIEADEDSQARAFGSFGMPYTTARVVDGSTSYWAYTSNRLSTTWPYRAIGKLYFHDPVGGGNYYCSASVIRQGVIVTAAHCVAPYGGKRWYSNWQFIPAYYNGTQPYGLWTSWTATIASAWYYGTDTGGGAARNNDLALLVLRKNTSSQFIGNRTGWFGYGWNNYSFVQSSRTGYLATAAVSTLGYPGLMDGGNIMQRTDGPSSLATVSGAKQIMQGSNFTGGSSGGPWIVNFASSTPALSGGAVAGTASTNAVIGVTSWGTSDPNAPKDNYSSQFSQNPQFPSSNYGGRGAGNIGAFMNYICNLKACGSSTYTCAQLGYCN